MGAVPQGQALRKLPWHALLLRLRHRSQRANMQHMIDQLKAVIFDDFGDEFLDLRIVKFNDFAGVHTHDLSCTYTV